MRLEFAIREAEERDLQQVRALQETNHFKNLSEEDRRSQGFVSIETDIPLLRQINKDLGILVAEADGRIIGYEMPLTAEYISQIPLLKPFFDRVSNLKYDNRKLKEYKSIVDGQICVDKNYRGFGIPEIMHRQFTELFRKQGYEIIVTEVSDKNPRSLHVATTKMGLEVIDKYEAGGRSWYILVQDIREKSP